MATKRNLHSALFVPSLGKKVKMEEHVSASSEAARGHEVGSSEQIWENAVQAIFGSQAKGFCLAQAEDIKQEMDEEEQKMLAKEITDSSESSQSGATKRQQFRQINQEGHGAASTIGIATPETGTSQLQAVTHDTDNASIAAEMQLLQEYFLHEEDMLHESTALAREQQVPWFGFENAVTFVCQKEKNLIVRCNFCLPVVKNISSPISSSSNVKLHFQKAHPEQLRAILSAVEARRSETLHGLPPIKLPKHQKPKQATLERWGFGKDTVTQNMLDRNIMDLIVGEALPLQIVEKPLFVRLVLLGLPKGLTVMCAQTLRERIERRAANMRETLAIQMGAVAQVATTADCWTDGKKRYLGVIAYWISPVTLNYEFGALACKRLKGHLTYNVLTKALHEVYVQYGIQNKIVCTTTDNSCNFVKAFCFLKAKELVDATNTSPDNDVEDDDVQEEAEMEFLPISESLDTVKKEDEEAADLEDFSLPPHHRCVSHTLTLVVTQDIEAMISNASKSSSLFFFRKHFSSLMEKCSKLWSKQKQSKQLAEYIYKQCGVYLKVPSKNQWNSTFDALKQLNELLSTLPLKVDAIMDWCSLARFTPEENLVVQEYTEIMWPLVLSLNILQGKNGMFMGYLLPTLYNLDHKLDVLENKPVKYTYCLQLLRSVRTALRERFAPFWDDKKLFLAACLHPHFKLDWLGSAQIAQINRDAMEALLKTEIQNTKVYRDGFSENNQEGDSLESGFFNFKSRGKKPAVETADEEVLRYLMCPSREMSSLHAFPRVMKSFLQYNTGIPSSAATEHLFSTDENNTILNRYHFSDDLFEQLVLLRQNRAVC